MTRADHHDQSSMPCCDHYSYDYSHHPRRHRSYVDLPPQHSCHFDADQAYLLTPSSQLQAHSRSTQPPSLSGTDGKWTVANDGLRAGGLVCLIGAVVCLLAVHSRSNCLLKTAMDRCWALRLSFQFISFRFVSSQLSAVLSLCTLLNALVRINSAFHPSWAGKSSSGLSG